MKKLIPDEVFIFYMRNNFNDVEDVKDLTKEQLIEMNNEFCEYIKKQNLSKQQLDELIPKPLCNVTLNEDNPLGHNNFSVDFEVMYLKFCQEQKEKYDKEQLN